MPAIAPTPASPLSTPPSTSDPATFDTRADQFLSELDPFRDQMNDLATNVYDNALYAEGRASAAGTSASNAGSSAAAAAASAASALNSPGTNGTSTSSLPVGLNAKTFTTQTGKAWVPGQQVTLIRTSDPGGVRMSGPLTAYNSVTGAATVFVTNYTGSGTFTDWTVALGGVPIGSVLPINPITSGGAYAAVVNVDNLFDANNIAMTAPTSKNVGDIFQGQIVNSRSGCSVDFGADKAWGRTPGVMNLLGVNDRFKLKWAGATYGWIEA